MRGVVSTGHGVDDPVGCGFLYSSCLRNSDCLGLSGLNLTKGGGGGGGCLVGRRAGMGRGAGMCRRLF